jgi:hypothetical protein
MSAEQFRDALGTMTGKWYKMPAAHVDFGCSDETWASAAKWIWVDPQAAKDAPEETIYLRKEFNLAKVPQVAFFIGSSDNAFTVYINGQKAGSGKEWGKPELVEVTKHLVAGENVLAVEATNSKPEKKDQSGGPNPGGFIGVLRIEPRSARQGEIVTDNSWLCSSATFGRWEKSIFTAYGWSPAAELGTVETEPWKLRAKIAAAISSSQQYNRTRSALVPADPLMVSLGRPNREQVLTCRATPATTLQALELTNGETLSRLLKTGAESLCQLERKPAELIQEVYAKGLGRKPTAQELKVASELVGQEASKESVEDLLWSVAMLPEFQLIF